MNREIKFRAWNAEYNEMIILENSGLQYYDFEGNYSLGFTVDAYSDFWAHEQYKVKSQEVSKFPIMQFTGLKDKNGKEIYEGDIVKWSASPMYGTSRVSFYDGAFRLADYVSEENYLNEAFCSKQTEVIGNIHENPDLLKYP